MESTVTEAQLALTLTEVLDRVRDGERFVVERDGKHVAVLSPPAPDSEVGILGSELVAIIGDLRVPGDGLADDIESAPDNLLPVSVPRWPA